MKKEKIIEAFRQVESDDQALDLFNTLNKSQGIVQINNQKRRIEAGKFLAEQYTWDKKNNEHVLYYFKGE